MRTGCDEIRGHTIRNGTLPCYRVARRQWSADGLWLVESGWHDAPYLAVKDNDEQRCYRRQCHLCALRLALHCHVVSTSQSANHPQVHQCHAQPSLPTCGVRYTNPHLHTSITSYPSTWTTSDCEPCVLYRCTSEYLETSAKLLSIRPPRLVVLCRRPNLDSRCQRHLVIDRHTRIIIYLSHVVSKHPHNIFVHASNQVHTLLPWLHRTRST